IGIHAPKGHRNGVPDASFERVLYDHCWLQLTVKVKPDPISLARTVIRDDDMVPAPDCQEFLLLAFDRNSVRRRLMGQGEDKLGFHDTELPAALLLARISPGQNDSLFGLFLVFG